MNRLESLDLEPRHLTIQVVHLEDADSPLMLVNHGPDQVVVVLLAAAYVIDVALVANILSSFVLLGNLGLLCWQEIRETVGHVSHNLLLC